MTDIRRLQVRDNVTTCFPDRKWWTIKPAASQTQCPFPSLLGALLLMFVLLVFVWLLASLTCSSQNENKSPPPFLMFLWFSFTERQAGRLLFSGFTILGACKKELQILQKSFFKYQKHTTKHIYNKICMTAVSITGKPWLYKSHKHIKSPSKPSMNWSRGHLK